MRAEQEKFLHDLLPAVLRLRDRSGLPASVVLGEIRTRVEELDQSSMEPGRDPFLTAIMDQSFSRMPRRSRTHLPFLSMFQQRVMLDILTHITQERAYHTVMGEELGWGACRTLLRSARDAGFIQTVSPSVYQIHPTLPWFYGRQINQQLSPSAIHQLEHPLPPRLVELRESIVQQKDRIRLPGSADGVALHQPERQGRRSALPPGAEFPHF